MRERIAMEPTFPVYYQIRRTIKHWILDKIYSPNEKIPTEQELSKQFDVTRMTIRQAVSPLVEEGLLTRKRGGGTFVTGDTELIQQMNLKHIGLTNELLLPLMKSKTLSVEKTEIEPNQMIIEKLELSPKAETIVMIKRDRLVPGGFPAYTINYLPVEYGRRITKKALMKRPLLVIMEDDLKVNFTQAYQTIEASYANEEVAAHLGIAVGSSTLFTERIMYSEKGKPVEVVNTIYRADQYRCSLQLKKVKRGSDFDWICQITK